MFNLNNLFKSENGKKDRLMVVIAVVLGLMALGGSVVSQNSQKKSEAILFQAIKYAPVGASLETKLFREVSIRVDRSEKLPFITKEAFRALKGKRLSESLEAGEYLSFRAVMPNKSSIKCCPAGKVAVSIDISNEAQGNAYSAAEGSAIDVWGEINGQAVLLKKHACVLAAGNPNEETRDGRYKSVTILIDEKEANCLTANLFRSKKRMIQGAGECDPTTNYPAACALKPVEELTQLNQALSPRKSAQSLRGFGGR